MVAACLSPVGLVKPSYNSPSAVVLHLDRESICSPHPSFGKLCTKGASDARLLTLLRRLASA